MSEWDVGEVTSMKSMFAGLKSFNEDLSKWDISRVTSTTGMFKDATAFNADISKWDTSAVADMHSTRDTDVTVKLQSGAAGLPRCCDARSRRLDPRARYGGSPSRLGS